MSDPARRSSFQAIRIGASRGLALERALLFLGPGVLLLVICFGVAQGLRFRPSGVSNRIGDYSLAIVMLPVALGGLVIAGMGLRWLAMAVWPGWLGIVADADGLSFHLGPMGSARYCAGELDVRYLFELLGEDGEGDAELYEALTDPQEQMASMLPRIRCARSAKSLERRIVRFTRMGEQELAALLRPFIESVRRDRSGADAGAGFPVPRNERGTATTSDS